MNIPLAKDNATVGKRCAFHPITVVDDVYSNFYGFLNIFFGGNGTLYTTEESFNAGMWYELPTGKTTTKDEIEELNQFMKVKKSIFEMCFYEDENHIFII